MASVFKVLTHSIENGKPKEQWLADGMRIKRHGKIWGSKGRLNSAFAHTGDYRLSEDDARNSEIIEYELVEKKRYRIKIDHIEAQYSSRTYYCSYSIGDEIINHDESDREQMQQ